MSDPRHAITTVLAALTATAIGLTGEVSLIAFAVPFTAIGVMLREDPSRPGRLSQLAFHVVALFFLAYFAMAALRGQLLAGAVSLTFYLQIHFLMLPPGRIELRRLLYVSFFQLVALAATTTKVLFLPLTMAWVVLAPMASTLRALEDALPGERRPVALPRGLVRAGVRAGMVTGVLAGALFLLLPRYELGLLRALTAQGGVTTSGFSDNVRFGDIGRIKLSNAKVMKVRVRGEVPAWPRWRGVALDFFTGRSWTMSQAAREYWSGSSRWRQVGPGDASFIQDYYLEPLDTRTLFHGAGAAALEPHDFRGFYRDDWGNTWRPGSPRARASYRVVSAAGVASGEPLPEPLQARLLQLPPMDPRIEELARSVVGDAADAEEKARRIELYLQSNYTYSLQVNDHGTADPVGRFLLTRSPGHCEYFATGMVVMLRSIGVPARIVNGFQAGTYSRWLRTYTVRQRDAHSWVEVWHPERGWTTHDPTPTAPPEAGGRLGGARDVWNGIQLLWDDHVIGFNYTHQLGFVTSVREVLVDAWRALGPLPIVGGIAAAAAGFALLLVPRWTRRGSPRPSGPPFYRQALRMLERKGWSRSPGQTPMELATQVSADIGPAAEPFVSLTHLYLTSRFGGGPEESARIRELLADVRHMPAQPRESGDA